MFHHFPRKMRLSCLQKRYTTVQKLSSWVIFCGAVMWVWLCVHMYVEAGEADDLRFPPFMGSCLSWPGEDNSSTQHFHVQWNREMPNILPAFPLIVSKWKMGVKNSVWNSFKDNGPHQSSTVVSAYWSTVHKHFLYHSAVKIPQKGLCYAAVS